MTEKKIIFWRISLETVASIASSLHFSINKGLENFKVRYSNFQFSNKLKGNRLHSSAIYLLHQFEFECIFLQEFWIWIWNSKVFIPREYIVSDLNCIEFSVIFFSLEKIENCHFWERELKSYFTRSRLEYFPTQTIVSFLSNIKGVNCKTASNCMFQKWQKIRENGISFSIIFCWEFSYCWRKKKKLVENIEKLNSFYVKWNNRKINFITVIIQFLHNALHFMLF
jgi:hypothetical protein